MSVVEEEGDAILGVREQNEEGEMRKNKESGGESEGKIV